MRLHECNLACTWCDAFYTWDKASPEYWSEALDRRIIEVADIMMVWMSQTGCHRWVITGGEPLIQGEQIRSAMLHLSQRWEGIRPVYEIETNGTIKPPQGMMEDPQVHFNVSPKLSSSGNPRNRTYKRDVLRSFVERGEAIFKFVVTGTDDIAEIHDIVQDTMMMPHTVYLMPEGTTPEAIREHGQVCAKLAMRYGWRVSPRLQIDLFGDTRRT
jgi:7-carboxy-7-deazaguanine synthase